MPAWVWRDVRFFFYFFFKLQKHTMPCLGIVKYVRTYGLPGICIRLHLSGPTKTKALQPCPLDLFHLLQPASESRPAVLVVATPTNHAQRSCLYHARPRTHPIFSCLIHSTLSAQSRLFVDAECQYKTIRYITGTLNFSGVL